MLALTSPYWRSRYHFSVRIYSHSSQTLLTTAVFSGKSYSWAEFNAQRYSRVCLIQETCRTVADLASADCAQLLSGSLRPSGHHTRDASHLLSSSASVRIQLQAVRATNPLQCPLLIRSFVPLHSTQHLLQRVAIYGVGTGAVTA